MTYNVTILTLRPGTQGPALKEIKAHVTGDKPALSGELLACWYSDIGALNRVLVLHRAASAEQALADRERLVLAEDPFGLKDAITQLQADTFHLLPFLTGIDTGTKGPMFEVRTYETRAGGMGPTVELWRKALPERMKLSPLLAGLYSVSGVAARFMHIWPYENLEARSRLRAKAVADGIWPPQGGPAHLQVMQSDIYLPAEFSPLR
ncbi:NIPSNAP family protein [Bradyrhizobium prioriisuperbiae]|uniref:NIPSNAP family protein n=1 Tax=Bradyrhizobium prioriisuperbiae TaxID=2854389 RepID=UPI0028EDB41A|nr:NIPSNAP family protein [Bradyrhizobium prioritasuperba]